MFWQLREMPKDMARCKDGKKAGILEILSSSFDCLS